MTTMNRLYNFNSERFLAAHLDKREMSFGFAYSSIDKHKRENCLLDTDCSARTARMIE